MLRTSLPVSVTATFLFASFFGPVSPKALAEKPSQPVLKGDQLMVLSIKGGEPRKLIAETGMHCGSPRWSPDGEWIAYDTAAFDDRDRKTSRVLVVKPDGTQRKELGLGGMPAWSREGSRLAWHTYFDGAVVTAIFQSTTGELTDRTRLIDHWGNPSWLPDGRLLTIRGGGLSYFDSATSEETLAYDPATGSIPYGYGLSPDGTRVALRQEHRGVAVLLIARLNDSDTAATERENLPILRLSGGKLEYASWSPDGKQIVFAWKKPSDNVFQIYTMDANEGEPTRLMGQNSDTSNLQPDYSPDGTSVVYREKVPNLVP